MAYEATRVVARTVPARAVLGWLRRGGRDLWRCPGPGLVHGLAMSAFGIVVWWIAHRHFWALLGAFSGFMLVAPVVATGLYAVSAALERGQNGSWQDVRAAWSPQNQRPLVVFGVLLALAATGWVLTSAALITRFAPEPIREPRDFLMHVVLAREGVLFELWLALGGLLAAPVFASSVVAIPLLMDRSMGVRGAVLTSWRVVLEQPGVMALWAGTLGALVALGMGMAMLGLVVIGPWLAHASWHAYRDLIAMPGAEAPSWEG
jgi:uncharacterized membrane protein